MRGVLKILQLTLMSLQLSVHKRLLLLSCDVDVTKAFLPLQVRLSHFFDVVLELDLVNVRELRILFPRVIVTHLRYQLL